MRHTLLVIAILTVVASATAGKKERVWQTGKLLDTERNRYFAGMVNSGSSQGSAQTYGGATTYEGTSGGSSTAIYRSYQTYVVESGEYVYLIEERLRSRRSKPARLIVNGPVKFAVEKRKLYLLDEDGKEHETNILKQVRKETPR
jgi:hypothetical protein